MSGAPPELVEAAREQERSNYRAYKDWRFLLSVVGAIIAVVGATILIGAYINYENIEALKQQVEVTYNTTRSADFESTAAAGWHTYLLVVMITVIVIPLIGVPISYLYGSRSERAARQAEKNGEYETACTVADTAFITYLIVAILAFAGAIMAGVLAIHMWVMVANDTFGDSLFHFTLVLVGAWVAVGGHLLLGGLHAYLAAMVRDVSVCETGGIRGAFGRAGRAVGRGARSVGRGVGRGARNVRKRIGFAQMN